MHVRSITSYFPGYVLPTSTLQPGRPDVSRLFIRRMTCRPPSNETVIVRTRVSLIVASRQGWIGNVSSWKIVSPYRVFPALAIAILQAFGS